MGPNYVDFLIEAWRVLKSKGTLRIAEVESRFIRDSIASNLDSGLAAFTATLAQLGFKRTHCDCSNNFFVLFEFEKVNRNKIFLHCNQQLVSKYLCKER